MTVHYAGCCHPVPGDQIIGIVTTGKGVTIHTSDCQTLQKFIDTPERWIDVAWNPATQDKDRHVARIYIVLLHQAGTVAAITSIIARENANIINMQITNRTTDYYEFIMDLEIKNLDHLYNIIAALRMSQRVLSVERR
jgi:GTP pyrophosphokinase